MDIYNIYLYLDAHIKQEGGSMIEATSCGGVVIFRNKSTGVI